jgi:hypothetical protein
MDKIAIEHANAVVEATEQKIIGKLIFYGWAVDGRWTVLKNKRCYIHRRLIWKPVFKSPDVIAEFDNISSITVNDEFEFFARYEEWGLVGMGNPLEFDELPFGLKETFKNESNVKSADGWKDRRRNRKNKGKSN